MSASARLLHHGDARPAHFPRFALDPAETAGPLPGDAALVGAERSRRQADEAEAVRQRVRAEAFQVGIAEGRAAAHAEWNRRLAELAASLEGAQKALLAARVTLAAEVDRQLPRALFLLARKVIHHELAASDTAARTVMRGLSERLAGCGEAVAIRLNPRLVETFENWRRSQPSEQPGARLRVEPDPSLGPGEWGIETRDGFLDGRVESQLETAWDLVMELPQ